MPSGTTVQTRRSVQTDWGLWAILGWDERVSELGRMSGFPSENRTTMGDLKLSPGVCPGLTRGEEFSTTPPSDSWHRGTGARHQQTPKPERQ
jgi:hypothetical protein